MSDSPRGARPLRRGPWLAAAVAGALLVTAVAVERSGSDDGPSAEARCLPTKLLVPPCGAWFGAYVRHDKPDLEEKVLAYEKRLGRQLDIVYTYHDMSTGGDGEEGTLLTEQERRVGQDRMLLLSWESKWWGGGRERQPRWKQIAAGKLDRSVIDVQAKRIKEYGKPVFLSFDLEMDSRIPEDGSPADFVAAHRHIHDRFRALGVANAVWVWNVTGYPGHQELFPKLYPGDDYVDWIGYNQYNYFRCHDAEWQSFERTQRGPHDWIRKNISDTKPLMLPEFGTADDPERPRAQADWYREVPRVVKSLEGVGAALQWNWRDPGPGCDLSLARDSSWKSLGDAVADPYFNQPRP
ncbi:glycoside hydrolase family 26 protein [Streptomyces sp. NPDC014894]|uniref:glycoside hydrolase family 26 protein n=1 Tax=Streptomyces sp. NPDC014894 TaxID=3364931 RepID=UPI0036FFFA7E